MCIRCRAIGLTLSNPRVSNHSTSFGAGDVRRQEGVGIVCNGRVVQQRLQRIQGEPRPTTKPAVPSTYSSPGKWLLCVVPMFTTRPSPPATTRTSQFSAMLIVSLKKARVPCRRAPNGETHAELCVRDPCGMVRVGCPLFLQRIAGAVGVAPHHYSSSGRCTSCG